MSRALVPLEQLASKMAALPDWTVDGDRISREFRFDDFIAAFGFMARVALVAQAMDHHPDWSNTYNVVRIALSTHDLGGISTWDLRLAERIDALAAGQTSGGTA